MEIIKNRIERKTPHYSYLMYIHKFVGLNRQFEEFIE